jgi:hypothetical protein
MRIRDASLASVCCIIHLLAAVDAVHLGSNVAPSQFGSVREPACSEGHRAEATRSGS